MRSLRRRFSKSAAKRWIVSTAAGIGVETPDIDLSAASRAFHVLRGVSYAMNYEEVLAQHRDALNPNVIWNIEFGLQLEQRAVPAAYRTRGELFNRMARAAANAMTC